MPRKPQTASVNVTNKDSIYIGLDVHKKSIHVAVWMNGSIIASWVAGGDGAAVIEQLQAYKPAIRMVAYEAGPTGFTLARALQAQKIKVMVCAPSKMPCAPGVEAKCDRLDAKKLAEYAAKGLLVAVAVPSESEENERALVRHRDHLGKKERRAKQQVKSLLLFHQIDELQSWSQEERNRVMSGELPAELRLVLESLFREITFYENEMKRVVAELGNILKQKHSSASCILQSHPGVGKIISAHFVLELFRPHRFKSGDAVARYIGLAPRVRQSGQTRRGGPLMKSGQEKLRSLLIESAWRWRALDPGAQKVYARLLRNTGNGCKAIVGLARRLAIRLWTMWIRGTPYIPADPTSL